MEKIQKNISKLIFFKKYIANYNFVLFSIFYFLLVGAFYKFSNFLDSEFYELVDICLEIHLFLYFCLFNYLYYLYNSTFYSIKKLNSNMDKFTLNSFYITDYNFNILNNEREEFWKFFYLLLFYIPMFIIFFGNLNQSDSNPGDVGYFILMCLSTFFYIGFLDSIKESYLKIITDPILIKKYKPTEIGIESYIIEIREHLSIFNKTSAFRTRIEGAINSIIDIYLINKYSLERLSSDEELSSKILNKNNIIENELRKMLFSIIEYNNERNEIILENIEHNIKIINSLRN